MSFSTPCSVNSQSSSSYEHRLPQPHTFADEDENPVQSAAKNIGVECHSSSSSSPSSSLIGRVRRSLSPESASPKKKVCTAASAASFSSASSILHHTNTNSWDSVLEACCRGDRHVLDHYQAEPENFWVGIRDDEERSALHLAIQHGHEELAQWLVGKCPALMYLEDSSGHLPGDLSKDHRLIEDLLERIIPMGGGFNVSKALEQLAFLCRLSNKAFALDYCRKRLLTGSKKGQMDTAREIPRVLQDHSSETHPFEVCAERGKEALALELIQMIESRLPEIEQIGHFCVACISRAKTLVKWLFKNGYENEKVFRFSSQDERLKDDRVTSQVKIINCKKNQDYLLQHKLAWVLALGLKDEGKALLKDAIQAILEDNDKCFDFKNSEEMQIAFCLKTIPDHPLTKEVMNDLKQSDRCRYLKLLMDITKMMVEEDNNPILDELKKTLPQELQEHLEEHPADFWRLEKEGGALVSMLPLLDCDSLAKQVFNCYSQSLPTRRMCLIELLLRGIREFNLDTSQGFACFKKLVEMALDQKIDCSLSGYGTTILIVHFLVLSCAENTVEILEWLGEKFSKEAQRLARHPSSFYGDKYALELALDVVDQARIVKALLKMGGKEILEHVVVRQDKAVKLKTLLLLGGSAEVHQAVDVTALPWSEEDIERALKSLPSPIKLTKDGVRALFRILLTISGGDGEVKLPWLRSQHVQSLLVYILAVVEKPEDLTLLESFRQLKSVNPEAFQQFSLATIVRQTLEQWDEFCNYNPSEEKQDTLIQALNALMNTKDLKEPNEREAGNLRFHNVEAPKVWYWWVTQYAQDYPIGKMVGRLGPPYKKMTARLRKETISQLVQNDGAVKEGKSYYWKEGGADYEFIPSTNTLWMNREEKNRGYFTYQGMRRQIESYLEKVEGGEIQEKIAGYWLKGHENVTPDFFDRPDCLIPKVLFWNHKYERIIRAYRIDPKTGKVEKQTFPFQRGLENVLNDYIEETSICIANCVEELKRSGIPVIYPATQDDMHNRMKLMKSEEPHLFVDSIGRKTTFFGIVPRLHEIFPGVINKEVAGIATVEWAQSVLEEFKKRCERSNQMIQDCKSLKADFLPNPFLPREKKFYLYYQKALEFLSHRMDQRFVMVPLPLGNKNVMVLANNFAERVEGFPLGAVCFKNQVIHKSRELLAIAEAIGAYKLNPYSQRLNNVIQESENSSESVFHEDSLEAVLKCRYEKALSETIDMFCTNAHPGGQTAHLKNYLRRTMHEIGFPIPIDRQELDMSACSQDYAADFPKEKLKQLFTSFLLPIMVQKVMEYQRSAKNTGNLLDALYDHVKKLHLLAVDTCLDIKKIEEERDAELNVLTGEIAYVKREIRQAKSSEIWKRIEEVRKKEHSLEEIIKDNASKERHLTKKREVLERKLAEDSEEPRRKKRKVVVKRDWCDPPSQEDVCKARLGFLGDQIKRLQDMSEAFSLQKKQASNEVNALKSQDPGSVKLEESLADLNDKRSGAAIRCAQNIRTLIEKKAVELQYVERDPIHKIPQLTNKGAVLLLEAFSYLQPSEKVIGMRESRQREVERLTMPINQVGLSAYNLKMEDDDSEEAHLLRHNHVVPFGGSALMEDEDDEG